MSYAKERDPAGLQIQEVSNNVLHVDLHCSGMVVCFCCAFTSVGLKFTNLFLKFQLYFFFVLLFFPFSIAFIFG